MKKEILVLFLLFLLGCQDESLYKNVGDIPFDRKIDSSDFELCNERRIKQYYVRGSDDTPSGYKGEKKALVKEFFENYNYPITEQEDGYITIRFMVNCQGQSGRFRVQEMDNAYQSKSFKPEIREQLLTITKSLDGWIPVHKDSVYFDFYQYLTFKLEDGQIQQIMP